LEIAMTRKSPLTAEALLLADQIEARRLIKARARITTLKAKQRGDLRKMPLTGKAALKAIKAGTW
jgi:pyruvate/2-oxoglutarate dehydrogenase complex dihydrolipoamide acyltransferase (E2) component